MTQLAPSPSSVPEPPTHVPSIVTTVVVTSPATVATRPAPDAGVIADTARRRYEAILRFHLSDPATRLALADRAHAQTTSAVQQMAGLEPLLNTMAALPSPSLSAIGTATAGLLAGLSLVERAFSGLMTYSRFMPGKKGHENSPNRASPGNSHTQTIADPGIETALDEALTLPVFAVAAQIDAISPSDSSRPSCTQIALAYTQAVHELAVTARDEAQRSGLPFSRTHLSGGAVDGRIAGRHLAYVATCVDPAAGNDFSADSLLAITRRACEVRADAQGLLDHSEKQQRDTAARTIEVTVTPDATVVRGVSGQVLA